MRMYAKNAYFDAKNTSRGKSVISDVKNDTQSAFFARKRISARNRDMLVLVVAFSTINNRNGRRKQNMKAGLMAKFAGLMCLVATAIAPLISENCFGLWYQPNEPEGFANFIKTSRGGKK